MKLFDLNLNRKKLMNRNLNVSRVKKSITLNQNTIDNIRKILCKWRKVNFIFNLKIQNLQTSNY